MRRMTRSDLGALVLALSISLVVGATQASAATILLSANVDGAQANAGAGTGSPGTGTIDLTLDDVTNSLSWSGSFSGLLTSASVAHFHGPALPNQNAGVTVGTALVLGTGGTSGTANGSTTITPTQAADLIAGLWYWNVHSSGNPGGEIRGNITVVPEPGTALLVGLGLASLATARRRRAA